MWAFGSGAGELRFAAWCVMSLHTDRLETFLLLESIMKMWKLKYLKLAVMECIWEPVAFKLL